MANRIREIRKNQGLTLQRLADLSGTTNQQISRLERSERRLTVDWMEKLAKVLGCHPADLMENGLSGIVASAGIVRPSGPGPRTDQGFREGAPVPFPPSSGPRDLPVLGSAVGGDNGWFDVNGQANEYIARPNTLIGVAGAYAVYVIGDSMSPALRDGHIVHVHPHRRPTPGSEVVVQLTDGRGLIKEFVSRSNETLVLRQHNPAKQFEMPADTIAAVHRIIGRCDP